MIGIIEYDTGNIASVGNALRRLNAEFIVSSDENLLRSCDKIILPGVGSAGWAMENLKKNRLDQIIPTFTQPVLGICLGMQLLCAYSQEDSTECLGIFQNIVTKFPDNKIRVPHTGWNSISQLKGELFNGIPEDSFLYFVHSYFADINENTAAITEYGDKWSAALQYKNFTGCQFHPEKSGKTGEQILGNFLKMYTL